MPPWWRSIRPWGKGSASWTLAAASVDRAAIWPTALGAPSLALMCSWRVQAAATLTQLVGLGDRVAYGQVDATRLPFAEPQFEQAWMLDVSIHIANKAALFGELARVVKPAGLLVLHDQMGPLPPAMRPVTRRAPYIAPALPQLVRSVEGAGFRVLTWRDTTDTVLTYMQGRRAELLQGSRAARSRRQRRLAMLTAYMEALGEQGSRTGLLIARRTA
jgi:SAM-dependent methyltransferase